MAFTESFHCDVCNKAKLEDSEDWWLAWTESVASPVEGEGEQPVMKLTPWNNFLAHSAEVRHLCCATCVHTLTGRWMLARL